MNYFSNIFGLVTKNDPITENGGLFFAHYLVLKLMLGMPITIDDTKLFHEKMVNSYVSAGLFLRSKHHKERTVSQDEQTGFFVSSYILKTWHRESIKEKLIKGFGNYPATGSSKFYNPASYYAWAVLSDSKFQYIFAPFYTLNILISSNKQKNNTSSKLLYLTELYCMKNESLYSYFLWKYFTWRMEKMYGEKWIKSLYDIYFASEDIDYPLRELAGKI